MNTSTDTRRNRFAAEMVAAGYSAPELGPYPDSQFLHQRDEDRYVGWCLATSLVGLAVQQVADPVGAAPVDMVLHCPACGMQHVDAAETDADYLDKHLAHGGFDNQWHNPPHRSHLCHSCGHIWRPADVPTNGVQVVKTTGKADSSLATMVDMTPPATSRDRWMYRQGWLAALDPRSNALATQATTKAEPVAWSYRNQGGNLFVATTDPAKWHPHDREGFTDFRPMVYAEPQAAHYAQTPPSVPSDEPVAWVRTHPDGSLTGELLMDWMIEPVRKTSGGWKPLYATPSQGKEAPHG